MNSKIAIYANGKPLTLPDDFSLDVEDSNPLFNDSDMFSYPVQIPLNGNRFLLGNMDDPMNADRPVSLEHTPMRIYVNNMPFRSGTLVTSEDEEIEDALTMNISASDQSLSELIGTLECRDIPLLDSIKIGEKIGAVTASIVYDYQVTIKYDGKKGDTKVQPSTQDTGDITFSPQALGFSFPGECETSDDKETAVLDREESYADGKTVKKPKVSKSFINVSDAYGEGGDNENPGATYCNARIAYYHYDIDDDGETSDSLSPATENSGPEDHWPYWVLDADRPQSGICFYVLYFLKCLFAYLNVNYDQSELEAVDDLKRLCFFTTHCKYTEEKKNSEDTPDFTTIDEINDWLDSRGCGGQFKWNDGDSCSLTSVNYTATNGATVSYVVGEGKVASITAKVLDVKSRSIEAYIMNMYASSDNFPDESVQTVLDSLWASFGIKFDYDYEKNSVRAYLVRNVFRSQEDPIDLNGKVIYMRKVAEKITGFRMCYSAESSSKEQQQNIKDGTKDYDTDYDYIDYPQETTITDKTYSEIFRLPQLNNANGNTNVYIDKTTGNAYRLKVNSDAEKASELKATLFEVGQFKGVELGDCSEINEDYVEELASDFEPITYNDVNYQKELAAANGTYDVTVTEEDGTTSTGTATLNASGVDPILAAFIDEDMEHEFIEFRIHQTLASNIVELYLDEVLELVESYDPSSTDDGNSPLQEMDWGLAIAVMRGGGTDATYQTYDPGYDGFNNSKWRTVAGAYALTSDSLDNFGSVYDYNGVNEGIGDGERFSLKIRAWKQPDWADAPLINSDIYDEDGNVTTKVKSRGLFDTFLSEYGNFVLKRRKYNIRMECSIAQLADIANNWNKRYRINNMVGYINKLSYSITPREGVKDLQIEFFVY